MSDHGTLIAEASLSIEAIKLNPTAPFTWASGFRMPIYNDNRLLLGDREHRRLVTWAFQQLIDEHEIAFDMVLGTSTAGIAPAASVAEYNGVPLLIIQDNKAFEFTHPLDEHDLTNDYSEAANCDIIVSTCPWTIPYGVMAANNFEKPFAYVRQSKKDHGMKQQIEGRVTNGQTAALISNHMGDDYSDVAIEALKAKGVEVKTHIKGPISDISRILTPADLGGRRVLVIEDLISTGGSSAEEVKNARALGGNAGYCLSIFSYELDKAAEAFASLNPNCQVFSCLAYDTLLYTAIKKGYLQPAQIASLQEWRADPFNWGANHGFPKVEKK